MATATTSKLNSKLPTVSKIAFCTSAGTGMATKVWTGENGKFTYKVGFKQNSKTYPFQIQWRQRSRYTNANAQTKGAQWTAWGEWKCACGGGGIPFNSTESSRPVNRWMVANKGINKNATYQTFQTLQEYQIPADYDCREFQYRIRTFNKSQARHGNWTTQTIQVFKRAEVIDETYLTSADGGLKIKFNYRWDRSGFRSWVRSVKDAQGRELLTGSFNGAIEAGNLTANTTPTPRDGYVGGMIKIPLSKLKRRIAANETLTTEIYFETADGAETRIANGTTIEPHRDIPMQLTSTWHEDRGLLVVSATNTGSIPITGIGASATYTWHGKTYSIPPCNRSVSLAGTSYFHFLPPIGVPCTVRVSTEDAEDFKDSDTITATGTAKGYRLNKADDGDTCGVAWGNPSWEMGSTPQVTTELPYGRDKNVAFYGRGSTNAITLSALILDKPNMYAGDWSRKRAWDKVRNNQGIYWFRTSQGDMYKVALTRVTMNHDTKDQYSLSVTMTEVV